ncbi:hypothetical protein ABEB36_014007 [Hypothenemus hampei]|uniref:Uncharacterized protein n=1 Tax=Hypothenemus hampei TaxID=57062 RepID=A0ABD1E538_HYPHA
MEKASKKRVRDGEEEVDLGRKVARLEKMFSLFLEQHYELKTGNKGKGGYLPAGSGLVMTCLRSRTSEICTKEAIISSALVIHGELISDGDQNTSQDKENTPSAGIPVTYPSPSEGRLGEDGGGGLWEVTYRGRQSRGWSEEVETVLGADPTSNNNSVVNLHQSLVARWPTWLSEGLPKEAKNTLIDKYPRKGNVHLEAPELNGEIAATLNESGLKRDRLFVEEQNLVGSALFAIGGPYLWF